MVGHGGSSAGAYLADPTSRIPSHCASIVVTSTLRVNSSANGRSDQWSQEYYWFPVVVIHCPSVYCPVPTFVSNRYSSFSSYTIILIFFKTRETGRIVVPCNKAGIPLFFKFQISLKCYPSFSSDWFFFTRETTYIVPPCNKTRICAVDFMNNYKWMYCQILQWSTFCPASQLVVSKKKRKKKKKRGLLVLAERQGSE